MIIGAQSHNDEINRRITAFGLRPSTVKSVAVGAIRELRKSQRPADGLVLLAQSPEQVWVNRSNGNCLWGIVRNYRLVTILLRRSEQPALGGLPVYDASHAIATAHKGAG